MSVFFYFSILFFLIFFSPPRLTSHRVRAPTWPPAATTRSADTPLVARAWPTALHFLRGGGGWDWRRPWCLGWAGLWWPGEQVYGRNFARILPNSDVRD
jgi:hypothetical protein